MNAVYLHATSPFHCKVFLITRRPLVVDAVGLFFNSTVAAAEAADEIVEDAEDSNY